MPLGQAIFRIMLDLNPSVYVIIDPCCPQMLKKNGAAGYYRFRIPDQTGELAALTASSGQKPGLNGPLRGDNYPDTGG